MAFILPIWKWAELLREWTCCYVWKFKLFLILSTCFDSFLMESPLNELGECSDYLWIRVGSSRLNLVLWKEPMVLLFILEFWELVKWFLLFPSVILGSDPRLKSYAISEPLPEFPIDDVTEGMRIFLIWSSVRLLACYDGYVWYLFCSRF